MVCHFVDRVRSVQVGDVPLAGEGFRDRWRHARLAAGAVGEVAGFVEPEPGLFGGGQVGERVQACLGVVSVTASTTADQPEPAATAYELATPTGLPGRASTSAAA